MKEINLEDVMPKKQFDFITNLAEETNTDYEFTSKVFKHMDIIKKYIDEYSNN